MRGRTLASDHVKPKLTIKLDTPPPSDETWWIRLTGLYNGGTYTDRFAAESGEAAVTDPEPGSYLVTVLSTKGYACVREVDVVEFTKSWSFRPSGCSLGLDRFAHLVQEQDKKNQKTGPWYKDIREAQEELQRSLQEATAKK